jgi:hypothetical protein
MEWLESDWFFRMLEQHGKTPRDKLVAMFTVAGLWVSAPGMREKFPQHAAPIPGGKLKGYLIGLASAAKANEPAMLASQLLILLHGALSEELRNPDAKALENARLAAQAVIQKSCDAGRKNVAQWAVSGSVTFALVAGLAWHMAQPAADAPATYLASNRQAPKPAYVHTGLNPSEMEAVLTLQENINRGACPAPQLLALPQGQATAYMNAIHFRTPENLEADRANLRAFLDWFNRTRATECYFAPSNGHTLVTWR